MAYLLLALAGIFWGGNYVAGHILVNYINPYALSIIRWGLTTLLMFSVYWSIIRSQWQLLSEKWAFNTLYAFLGQVCFPLTLYIGLQYTSSLNAAIYISSTPCIVLLINFFLFKENITLRNILGVIVSTFGVIYLSYASSKGALSSFGIGDLFTIISALSWAFYCALLRLKDKRINHTAFVGFCSLVGTFILIPIYIGYVLFTKNTVILIQGFSFSVILGVIYLVLFPSWLAYVFWNKGVSMIGTTRSEIFTHVIPLSGGLLGIILLDEQIHLYHLVSLILIVFGIICCSGTRKKAALS